MPRTSAGLLMFRVVEGRSRCCWSIPAGRFSRRKTTGLGPFPRASPTATKICCSPLGGEFTEETGLTAAGPLLPLGSIQQKGGKIVHAWAFAGDCDPRTIQSNSFTIEWPPKSGRQQEFPEIDRAEFFTLESARRKLRPEQIPLLDRLADRLRQAQR